MSRISRIVELGIEDLTTQLYDQHRSFSEVAQELNRRNYPVSMVQVRAYLTSLPPKAISLTDSEPEYTEITRSPRSADADEMETFPPISQLVPYNQKAEGHSIFDVVENLDQDHNFLVRLLESDQNTTIDTSLKLIREKRATTITFVNVAERAQSYQQLFAFMQDVIGVMDEVSPDVKKDFLDRLQRRQALRITHTPTRGILSSE